MPELDESQEALRNVERIANSERAKGEYLLGSEKLKQKLADAKKRIAPRHIEKGAIGPPFDHGSMPVNSSLTLPVCVVSQKDLNIL